MWGEPGCAEEKEAVDTWVPRPEPEQYLVLEGLCPPQLPSFCSCVSSIIGLGSLLKKTNKGGMKPLIFWLGFETAQKSPPPV